MVAAPPTPPAPGPTPRPSLRNTLLSELAVYGGAAILYGSMELLEHALNAKGVMKYAIDGAQFSLTAAYITAATNTLINRGIARRSIVLPNYPVAIGMLFVYLYGLMSSLVGIPETYEGDAGAFGVGAVAGFIPALRRL